MEQDFKNLFSPIKLGNVTMPNRIILTGAFPRLFGENRVNYFAARARGGAGMLMSSPHLVYATNDSMIPEHKAVADAVHQYPTKIFAQLFHHGARMWPRMMGGGASPAPSNVKVNWALKTGASSVPHAMDKDEIKRVVKAYGQAALVMKKAGYDGIEIMAAWGLLQSQFLSPTLNLRTDEYGGSLENRLRFLLECLESIREQIGPEMPLGVRFNGDEFIERVWWTKEHGNTLDDAKEMAKILEASGTLTYLFGCADAIGAGHVPPMHFPLGAFTYISAGLKEVVDLPVVCVGRINDPVLAENILANNQADMVGMTRALMCDPEMPNKAREGRLEEIRHCIACNEGCVGPNFMSLPIACSLNYETGREGQGPVPPAEMKKTVMVVGGGAAGMEAARVCALRGHAVSLYEKNDILAKDLDIAAKAPGRQDFDEAKRYLVHQMKLLNVDVKLGVEVTPETVAQQQPDAVIIATGGLPFMPDIPGTGDGNVVTMKKVLAEEVDTGQSVLVVDYQHHLYGLDAADFLAEKGKQVQLITDMSMAGSEVDTYTIETAYRSALGRGVVITPLTSLKDISGKTATVYDVITNAERTIENIDTVVVCTDETPNDALYNTLKGKVKELHLIGQALAPRRLLDSIADAYTTARAL